MAFKELVLVLGKRLNRDQLTDEGMSRVTALVNYVSTHDCSRTIVAFCGGVTHNQSVSEASAMHAAFVSLMADTQPGRVGAVLLEEKSTNTVENIEQLSRVLIESQLIARGGHIPVRLLSNDYHLRRLVEIQKYLDAQGLLRLLKMRCESQGVCISLSYDINDHIAVPYPHKTRQGQMFLALDELTTYRVYLEGIKSQVFSKPEWSIREKPLSIAKAALQQLRLYSTHPYDQELQTAIQVLNEIVDATTPGCGHDVLVKYLSTFDRQLKRLNAYLDPESEICGQITT
ncbi:hypothetical protein BCU70_03330 [Vibrio sp. 10N.286.49.C2]|uniref:YdcF family protein n=1 Tax=unclassified Vibrio TaxID=2614977 RepID=UPI000C8595D5|nr:MULTISPECIES: YdcF family protein [unclassified Vibrio]PMH38316.1 hypothetical protein BCU70_03330 [Vibrio sp. 10N.286.49.C2]PMH55724.1 hypothetical protein BCU66_08925 [Vibrio sp. 10N.286.49.B1]PMH80035.1 hypothetical protein BCU58_04095 [Vibrio sp. 10N.286.48.B7]